MKKKKPIKSKYEFHIWDDPYVEPTEEQKDNVEKWYDRVMMPRNKRLKP